MTSSPYLAWFIFADQYNATAMVMFVEVDGDAEKVVWGASGFTMLQEDYAAYPASLFDAVDAFPIHPGDGFGSHGKWDFLSQAQAVYDFWRRYDHEDAIPYKLVACHGGRLGTKRPFVVRIDGERIDDAREWAEERAIEEFFAAADLALFGKADDATLAQMLFGG